MKKNKKDKIVILVLLIIIICIIVFEFLSKNNRFTTYYCESKDDNYLEQKYYEFDNDKLFKITTISTNNIDSNTDINAIKSKVESENDKSNGIISKFWNDKNTFTIYEIKDFSYMDNNTLKVEKLDVLKNMSLNNLKKNVKTSNNNTSNKYIKCR